MPRPSKYVSRSDLGWGTSPASRANPRSGLVIHYDSVNQGLAGKDHSACLTYWRNTRNFHTGPSRGWADIGYCADEETEILTEDGWRSFRELRAGDTVLTLDHGSGTSRWQPVQAVNVFPATERTLIRMAGRSHSSLTTANHRWPVARTDHSTHAGPTAEEHRVSGERWATTASLTGRDRIRVAAPCDHLPDEPKWPDALVTEVARTWSARAAMAARLREHAPGGVPGHAFLRSLTAPQLRLLLGEFAADGACEGLSRSSAEALQFAAVLAGKPAHLCADPGTDRGGGWSVAFGRHQLLPVGPGGLSRREETYGGHIWCPTTPNGTWLARRRGTVYFTGNSFMACAHGYVIEGRGLYRAQAAQPGGNSSHYSCTLATGPTDAVTPEQINAVRVLRQWLMEPDTSIAGTVLGHRDFIATSCPGDRAYRLVRDGTFTQPPGGTEGDDMPRHRRFEKDNAQAIDPRTWVSLAFDRRHDGETGEFYSLVGVDETDGAYYDVSVGVVLEGVTPGSEVQIRATEYERSGDGGWKIARNRPLDSPVHAGGGAHFTYSWKGNLAAGRRVRIRVAQFGEVEAHVTSATADVFYWPR
ncbi:N-acetylmuramoyl-L-alanine amidase [Nocardiopsis valliformis]|uniref:N-acetylmuramoyl-L-alanine amidase n=1 Tax=Nocardiopsis valliformis TaxID=239974 RepID=UPI001EF9CED3|nr:N-acetylmuramoyl-L-alanine amidase [Nocardiopsis valliformis]